MVNVDVPKVVIGAVVLKVVDANPEDDPAIVFIVSDVEGKKPLLFAETKLTKLEILIYN
jgi:hypothetical protein